MGPEFKHMIVAINEMVEGNILLECKKSGLYCKTIDDATICLIEIFIDKEHMSEYTVNEGDVLGLNINLLNKALKTSNKPEIITLEQNDYHLKVISHGSRKCEFEIPLVDILKDDMHIPEIDYDCSFQMTSTAFSGTCKDLKPFGDQVLLKISDGVEFSIQDELKCTISVDVEEIENEDNIKMEKKYDLKYLLKMLKAGNLSTEVNFYVSDTMPLVVEYKINEESYVRYYLGNIMD